MSLYRVVLVDDEEEIRVGISQKMPWNSLGFELVGEAENGNEALELCEALRPDVVLTDIQMPFMDGLQLCGHLSKRLPASKFVIFSGYDEFEYAKKAIQVNASEYILKPIHASELSLVLQRLKEQLDTERAERRDTESLRLRYEESLPILRELFYVQMLDGNLSQAQIKERAKRYQIDLSCPYFAVALAHMEINSEERELLAISVKTLFSEHFQDSPYTCHIFLYNDQMALLLGFSKDLPINDLIDRFNRGCKLCKSYLGIKVSVGLGKISHGIQELSMAREGAVSALDYRVLLGTERALYIGDLEPHHQDSLSLSEQQESALVSAIKLGAQNDVNNLVEELLSPLHEQNLSLSQLQLYFLEILTALLRLSRMSGVDMSAVFGPDFSGSVHISDFASPKEMADWVLTRCLCLQQLIEQKRTDTAGLSIEKAKLFIQTNYAQPDLSVEMLCGHLHLSPAYFSTLFKRETGMSFTSYVTEVRMDQASILLRSGDEKTYQIAQQVGYVDANYFSYVFKRHFGVSPTKYRSS